MPDVDKFVIIGVPHTSNWDAIAASLSMLATGFKYFPYQERMVLLANGADITSPWRFSH